jgi:DNA-binding transcriptional LysR family regulator
LAGAIRIIGHADFIAEVVTMHLPALVDAGIRVRLQPAHRDLVQQMLIEGHFDLGISAYPITDTRLRSELLREEPLLAVASPVVAARILAQGDLGAALSAEPMLSHSLDRPLIDTWLGANGLGHLATSPAVTSPDLRILRNLLVGGIGWSVLPEYLCEAEIADGRLAIIPAPRRSMSNPYSLVWLATALRQPRVAHARQTLLRRFRQG